MVPWMRSGVRSIAIGIARIESTLPARTNSTRWSNRVRMSSFSSGRGCDLSTRRPSV